ncbi:MAG: hypothetical protein IKJ32_04950 [Clostridia bacterium]|nr:hypothetical protein [Clostridia bacterium]
MDFSKLFNVLGKAVKDAAKDYAKDYVEGHVNIGGVSNSTPSMSYDIPSEYSNFPVYPGEMSAKPITTATSRYNRITLFYKGSPSREYYDTLTSAGYSQYSSVRYDKDNTYVIVEKHKNGTKIAYHIKK